jgi:hypothetical protein
MLPSLNLVLHCCAEPKPAGECCFERNVNVHAAGQSTAVHIAFGFTSTSGRKSTPCIAAVMRMAAVECTVIFQQYIIN